MDKVLDLHIHSRYSRACSTNLTLENIAAAARIKGISIIATGDFTHPQWFLDIKNKLTEVGSGGLYKLKSDKEGAVKFILSAEVALIYKDGGKARRLHLVVHAPSVAAVKKLNDILGKNYNIRSDGRPILGISAPKFVRLCLNVDSHFLIYPAHIWTPWFSVFGSKSGFNSLEECFHEETENIYAYETGLSSDPEMNWRLSALDKLTCLSNSDAHSLANLGREANVMDLHDETYQEIYEIIKKKDAKKLKYTIEFYPEEGMYHLDGHRDCHFSCDPQISRQNKNICPICRKPLVLGVAYRVEELADRPPGFKPKAFVPFKKVVGLDKIIAEVLNVKSRNSKKVVTEYNNLIKNFGNEIYILLDLDLKRLAGQTDRRIIEGIRRSRSGELIINPGFDGQYGEINIFSAKEKLAPQIKLF